LFYLIKGDETGWVCGTYGKKRKCIEMLVENVNERDNLTDLGVDGRILLK
jgi:hypothetical protein